MIRFFKKLVRAVLHFPDYIPHMKTKMSIITRQYPNIIIKGRGRFNQEVIFYGQGQVTIGEQFSFGYRYGGGYHGALCEIQPRTKEAIIKIGKNIATNNGVVIVSAGRIDIGDNCLIGQDVLIIDYDAHSINPDERRTSIGNIKSINIGNNVWIGSRVVILPGTKVGNNCVVGAGAIVKGEFPDNTIIAGNPAIIVKTLKLN